jgi:hypothetical protein
MKTPSTLPVLGPIELRVERVTSLFDPLDPFPLPSRDLSKSAEEFIVSWARELPHADPIRIVMHMPASELQQVDMTELRKAFANYFNERAERVQGDLNELLRTGRISLAIGVAVLAACVLSSQILTVALGVSPLQGTIAEGLIILGRVANWRPAEIFLYDWWPMERRRRLLRRLARAQIGAQLA